MMRCAPAVRLCCLLLLTPVATVGAQTTGFVLAHGSGNESNAAEDYWTLDFVDIVRDGLADRDNYAAASCNFELFAWEEGASGCLADSILGLVDGRGVDDVVVYTHSNGGNVMRYILSNPTTDARFQRVIDNTSAVVAIAASSGGTPLADAVIDGNVFEEVLGWLLGYATDSVEMQTEDNMALYNSNGTFNGTPGAPALPVPFYNIVGTDVDSSLIDLDSYCGSYAENVALELTQNLYLASCSDGFINCSSQELAGIASLDDLDFTEGDFDVFFERSEEPLSHGQSRRDCFGLPEKLRDLL